MARDIYRLAEVYEYQVVYRDLHTWHPGLDGYALTRQGLIFLERSIKGSRQGKCVLAEEVGHCLYPPIGDH